VSSSSVESALTDSELADESVVDVSLVDAGAELKGTLTDCPETLLASISRTHSITSKSKQNLRIFKGTSKKIKRGKGVLFSPLLGDGKK